MSVEYNANGYPIYSGGNGGYVENSAYEKDFNDILDEINFVADSKQNKLEYAQFTVPWDSATTTMSVWGGTYSDKIPFTNLESNQDDGDPFVEVVEDGIKILKEGLYLINASIYCGSTATIAGGIYIYGTSEFGDYEINSAMNYFSAVAAGAKFTPLTAFYLNTNQILYTKGRNNSASTTSMTIYLTNQQTFLNLIRL